ncbi:MAG: hypothetical protein E6R03_13735 [Hyphomicrobiaceae bacterium]|nr:MAG: hypothetical protein E6R03_13735 [Hyphomicrobiaceae bacterium]
MTTPTILLDVDDVLADFPSHLAKRFNLPTWVLDEYDVCRSISDIEKIDIKEVHAVIGEEGFCGNMPVLPFATALYSGLAEIGEVKILTAPWNTSRFWHFERLKWLEHHFKVHPTDVIFTHRKWMVRGDILIDDRYPHIKEWCNANPNGHGYRIMTPYDRRKNDNPNATNVYLLKPSCVDDLLKDIREKTK